MCGPHLRGRTSADARQRHTNCTPTRYQGPLSEAGVTQRRAGPSPNQLQGSSPQLQKPLLQFPRSPHQHQRSPPRPQEPPPEHHVPLPTRHSTHPLLVPPPFRRQCTKVYTTLHPPPAGKLKQQTSPAAHVCSTTRGRLFFTDRYSKRQFLIDTGSDLCVYPRRLVPRRMERMNYGPCTANGTTIHTYGWLPLSLNFGLRRDFMWRFVVADVTRQTSDTFLDRTTLSTTSSLASSPSLRPIIRSTGRIPGRRRRAPNTPGINHRTAAEKLPNPGTTVSIYCDTSAGRSRPYVAAPPRLHVFQSVHDLSHPGTKATAKLVAQRFVWPGVRKDCRNWTRDCQPCQHSKVSRHTVTPLGNFTSYNINTRPLLRN
jgi:hypothetical protein